MAGQGTVWNRYGTTHSIQQTWHKTLYGADIARHTLYRADLAQDPLWSRYGTTHTL